MTKTIPTAPARSDPAPQPAAPPATYAAIAGVLGAGVALGVGELLSGFSRSIPSLVLAVGDVFVDNTPGDATETAVRTLGTNDKPFLLTTIVIASLVFGAVFGVSGSRQRGSVAISLGGFGLIGGWAAARVPCASSLWSWSSAALSATLGALVILGLLKVLDNAAARAQRGRLDASPATS